MHLHLCDKSESYGEQSISYVDDYHEDYSLQVVIGDHVTLTHTSHYLDYVVCAPQVLLRNHHVSDVKSREPSLCVVTFLKHIYKIPCATGPVPKQTQKHEGS